MTHLQIMESSCLMRLNFPTDQPVTLETAYQTETITENYLKILLITNKNQQVAGFKPLALHVDVADNVAIGLTTTITAMVTLLYEYDNTLKPLELDFALTQALKQNDAPISNFTFATDASKVFFFFNATDNDSTTIDMIDEGGHTSTEVGLIVVTSFLSVVLVFVSSVLLFITGGWKVCRAKLTDCLFEDVEDEEYVVANKQTYPIQTSEDDSDDEESTMTSVPPSSSSGILGVARNRDHPAAGLGIMSLGDDDDDSSMVYGDGMTPVSQSNSNALGITSMRKLPKSGSPHGGMPGLVLQRLTRSGEKVK